MSERRRISVGLLAVTASMLVVQPPVRAQAPERFDGILASTSALGSGLFRIRIQIEDYTTDAEAQEFIDILANEGWQKLEDAFLDVEKGRIIGPNQRGYNIAFARSFPHETGRLIRLATARPIVFAEAYRNTRSREYAFGIIELRLDENGEGSGIVIAAAKAEFTDDGQLSIESYGHPPLSISTISVRD